MKSYFLLIWFFGLPWNLATTPGKNDPGYISEFGKNRENAEDMILKNKEAFCLLADSFSIPYNEIIPIIFPELVRHSALQNKIEVTLLKTLYVYKNIQGVNRSRELGQNINSTIKNNEICFIRDGGSILNLSGKVIFNNSGNVYHNYGRFWMSRNNKLQAWFEYRTLHLSDGRMIENMFSPIVQTEGGIDFLCYFYCSLNEDAIVKCKISF